MTYRPRRANVRRWLEGAPGYVLSVHDNGGKTADRYTVAFGGRLWDPAMGSYVFILCMSGAPYHPQGVCMSGEIDSGDRDRCLGRKIRWTDLPEPCQRAAVAWAEEP